MRSRLRTVLPALACLLAAAPLAAQNDIAGASDPALFPRLANYYIWSYSSNEPEIEPFRNAAGGRDSVEGRITRVRYGYRRSAGTPPSGLAILRHYRDIIVRNTGTVLYEQRAFNELSGRFVLDGREYWVGLTQESASEYNLMIAERPAPAGPAVGGMVAPSGAGTAPAAAGIVTRSPRVLPRGTPVPSFSAPPRLNLAPTITSFAPGARQSGELVRLAGSNLEHPTAVRFIDSRGEGWSATVFSYEACSDNLKVVVPAIPVGQYRIEVSSALGSGQTPSPLQVFQTPVNERPDAQQRLRVALRRAIDTLQAHNMLTAASAGTLRQRVAAGQYAKVDQALDAFQDAMVAEAEQAVGGPVNETIVAVALKTGKPVREIAMQWRHCHAVLRQQGIGQQGGVVVAGATISSPRAEGAVLGGCGAGASGARWHSHVTPMGISNAVMVATAINSGTAPASVPEHYHSETGFAAGTVWYASVYDDSWYGDFVDAGLDAVDWVREHSDTVISIVKITGYAVLGTVGCVVGVVFTAGAGCAAAFIAVAGPIAKETAKILVQEEVVTVDGVSKQTLLAGIDMVPVG